MVTDYNRLPTLIAEINVIIAKGSDARGLG